jgi:hypothetical protein
MSTRKRKSVVGWRSEKPSEPPWIVVWFIEEKLGFTARLLYPFFGGVTYGKTS